MVQIIFLIFFSFCNGAETSYTEKLRREIQEKDQKEKINNSFEGYTEREKARLESESKNKPETTGSFIDAVKKSPEFKKEDSTSGIEKIEEEIKEKDAQRKEEDPDDSYRAGEDSAIKAVHQGDSELELKRPGRIRHGFGFSLGAAFEKKIKAGGKGTGRSFSEVYGKNWTPDISIFYEIIPFYNEYFGNLSLLLGLSIGYYEGVGKFEYPLTNEKSGEVFGDSKTKLFFYDGRSFNGFEI